MTHETKKMIAVDAEALRQVLVALNGPPELIRRMQEGRAESGNPINDLVRCFLINGIRVSTEDSGTVDSNDIMKERARLFADIAKLKSEVKQLRQDAERYRWLREHYASADFEPEGHGGMDLIFSVPQGRVSGDCDKTIDGLMANDTEL